jgi:hypothetical protein
MLKRVIGTLLLLTGTIAQSTELHLLDGKFLNVDESFIEYRKYEDYRNPYITNVTDWDFTGHFHNTYSIYKIIFWQTDLHLSATKEQVRYAGLEYYLGIHILPWLDAGRYHDSEHNMDHSSEFKYPVEDSYFIRVYFKKL